MYFFAAIGIPDLLKAEICSSETDSIFKNASGGTPASLVAHEQLLFGQFARKVHHAIDDRFTAWFRQKTLHA
ncbi:MAG: hypothetical protein RLN82_11170 [Pseudomonadales bacterium]